MGGGIQKMLNLAVERARQAEAFYKGWAQRANGPAARVLFGELGAAKHEQRQMLEHTTPADVVRGASDDARTAIEPLVLARRAAQDSLAAALAAGLECEESTERLYRRLGELGGDAASLFRSLADESRTHAAKLRTLRETADGSL